MQKKHVPLWGIIGCVFCLSQSIIAQNIFNSPATNSQNTALTPTTVSNTAFRAKVKTQIDAVKNEIAKDAQQQTSDAMASGKQKNPLPEPETQENTDTTTTVTSPSTTDTTNNAGTGYNQAPSTYVAPPSTTQQAPTPANNNRSNNSQGSWQIQY